MSRHVVHAGGFYAYIARGLGRPPAVAGALVAVVAYNAVTIALAGGFGYFANIALDQVFSIHVRWEVLTAVAVAVIALLGYRQVDLSARVLAVLIVLEIGILLVLDIAVM